MLRLTLLLIAGIGVAMIVGGRDFSPAEKASLGAEPVQTAGRALAIADAAPAPVVAPATTTPVVVRPVEPQPMTAAADVAIEAPSPDAVADAVRLALGQDLLEQAPTPEAGLGAAPEVVADATPETAPPSVADEVQAALSESQVWYVSGKVVNVREGPDTSYPVVGKVVFGEATEILSDPNDDWVKIRIQGDGVEGYMARRFLTDSEPNG